MIPWKNIKRGLLTVTYPMIPLYILNIPVDSHDQPLQTATMAGSLDQFFFSQLIFLDYTIVYDDI